VLRIHPVGFERADAEEGGVEAFHIIEKSSLRRHDPAWCARRFIQPASEPDARRAGADDVLAFDKHAPKLTRAHYRPRKPASYADDGDWLVKKGG